MSDIQSLVSQQLEALLENENNTVSNLSNAAALIFQNYENINWAGFYIYIPKRKSWIWVLSKVK